MDREGVGLAGWVLLGAAAVGASAGAVGCTRDGQVTPGGARTVAAIVLAEEASLAPAAPAAGRRFGRAVALTSDGTIAVVGAPEDSVGAPLSGAAFVLEWNGTGWTERVALRAPTAEPSAGFGSHVAISGDGARIAVGAPQGGVAGGGVVHVFARSGASYVHEVALTLPSTTAGDGLSPVALDADGDTLVVGAPSDDLPSCTGCGVAAVLERGPGGWSLASLLASPDAAPFEGAGWSVAVSGDGARAVVGVPREDTFAVDVGGARTFVRDAGGWSHEGLLSVSDAATGDGCGLAVAIAREGARVAVGCPLDDVAGVADAGSVRVFALRGGRWEPEATLAADTPGLDDRFGFSVAVRADGGRVAAGAPFDDVEGAVDAGSARVFDLVRGTWAALPTITPSSHAARDLVARSVALSAEGTRLLVGGEGADVGGADAGLAWSFSLRLSLGDPCVRDAECDSGRCVDGVCCNEACGGGAVDCMGCSAALTGRDDGTCAPLAPAVAATVTCRAAAGPCDEVERCTPDGTTCPEDARVAAGRFCRVAMGPCDVAERCDGVSVTCPDDQLAPAGVECRPIAGDCDVVERCDGARADCPDDDFVAAGTVCRPARDVCDVPEACSGIGPSCPRDRVQPEGASCGDADRCNGDERCAAGVCVSGPALDCDDGDACTADACDALAGCTHTRVDGCCNTIADCDDGDPCTADACSGAAGSCAHTPVAGCPGSDGGVDPLADAGHFVDGGVLVDAGLEAGDAAPGPTSDGGRLDADVGAGGPAGGGACTCGAAGTDARGRAALVSGALLALGTLGVRRRRARRTAP